MIDPLDYVLLHLLNFHMFQDSVDEMFLDQRLSAMADLATVLFPREHWAMSGDTLGYHNLWEEGRCY